MITYTPESLEIGLTLRLYANSELGYEDLVLGMFQEDPKSLPKSVERRLRELYIKHQKLVIQHQGKNFIAEFVKNGDTKLIKRFLELTTNGEEAELFKGIEEAQDIQSRLEKLEELNEAKKISKSFRRYFNNQMRVFVKTGIEDEFRVILKEWLTSGEVNLKTWQQIKKWHKDGCELKTFRTMKLKDLAETDVLVHKVRDLAQRITTDEFLEPAMITKTMDRILREPTSKRVGGKVIVSSGTIFIDNWDDWFKKEVDKGAKQIEIYADNCLALMGDILIPETNLVICTSKVRVWKKSSIDLSGRSHEPKKRKARDSTSSSDNSKDGVDGQPGGSSGNLTIFTKAFVGQELLDIQLNGGRGEDGESGGDGYTGGDGKGVDWAEMRDLASFYSSLYWSYWSKYTGFEPSGWKNTYYNWNTGQQYCYKTFEDSAGRKLTLSYAGISLHWYTPTQYHLFLWVEGAEGETGTRGGKNGMGGEGGYKGECLIMNPETKQQFAVATTRLMGENGENGQPGEAGSNGKRGNDLAIIDNSAGSKVELGDTNSRLKMEWYGSEGDYRRFFGYKKHVDSESHPFIKFENGGSLSKSLLESTISTSQRSQFSKSVAQNAIITEEVLERSNENFDGESTFVEQIGLTLNDEEEEEEEEQSEEQSVEQVVVLRQADQVNLKEYTEESLKRAKPPLTASKVATAVKKTGRHGIITATAQCLFDLFQIEIDWNLLEDLRFPTLFQKNHFVHAVEEVPLQRTLIAISQNMIQKGKSYLEIHEFARSVALRRKLKFELTEKRHLSSRAIQELIGIDENYQKDLSECKNKKYLDGCRAGEPVAMGDIELKELIDSVGRDFSILYTKNEELLALQHFLKSFPSHLKVMIENNLKNDQMIWSNGDGEAFLAPYLKKAKEEENDHVDGETPQPPRQNEPLTELTEEQRKKFKNIVRGVNSEDNSERINESISLLRDLFKAEPTLAKRYGTLPKLLTENPADHQKKGKWATKLMNFVSQKDSEDEKKLTVFLIKAHFIAQEVLPFHRRLFNCNLLTKADAKELELSDFVNDLEDKDYSNFVKNLKSHTLDLSKKLCLEEMKRKRNSSSAVLYLKALADKSQITAYKLSGYKRLEECWVFKGSKETKDQNEERFVISEERAFEIEVDQDYHQFLASQQTIQEHFGLVDQKEQIPTTIQQFFEKELQPIVLEWLETFSAVAKFDQLLNFLATRFFIDGCHLSLFELQFVFSTFTHLTVECRADPKFLLTLLSTVSQTRFVDVFLYIRLCYLYGKKLEDKIWHNLRFISNPRHKIILALKLVEHKNVPSTDTLYKLILMLQHSSTDSQKLENLSMEMWIDIALKQTWAEIGSMMNEFGEAGYYLGVLASKGFTEEQKAMSSVLKSVKFIPEKLLGLFVTWICNGEFGENSLEAIRELEGLKEADDWSDEEKKGDCAKLLTNEKDQKNFFDHIGGDFLRKHEEMRTTESLKHLVVGMHDDAEMNAKVSARVEKCCDALQSLEKGEELNEICGILARFDGYLKEIEGKTLRNTQKMAVLCAVEGNGHVLEQVNTGEGKSFIIAAIAVVRCLRDNSRVDIITSSPVLAQRDAEAMTGLYKKFGLTVSHNCSEKIDDRKKAYQCHIVYGDIQRFQRDYLMHTFYKKTILGNRSREVVIVDEVDNMLLDNGNNILYLSHDVPCLDTLRSALIYILKQVKTPIFNGLKNDMNVMRNQFSAEKIANDILTQLFGRFTLKDLEQLVPSEQRGAAKKLFEHLVSKKIVDNNGLLSTNSRKAVEDLESFFSQQFPSYILKNLISCLLILINRSSEIQLPTFLQPLFKLHLKEFVDNCIKALLMKEDEEYVVDQDRTGASNLLEPVITIIDGNTGADLPTTQWTGGLHQFLQMKHGCHLSPISLKAVFVSNVAYLKGYSVINGLSGTLGSKHESKTLIEMYGAHLIRIPPFKKKLFHENCPVIKTKVDDWAKSVYDEICDQLDSERSTLVICDSIAQAVLLEEKLRKIFEAEEKKSSMLDECFKTLTMYTRSHDQFNFDGETALQPGKLLIATNLAGRGTDIKLSRELEGNGGLHVITAFMPQNARIEEQAFGRAARSGQPGSAQIIALLAERDGIKPSFFQFKMYRDNLEVQRLAELKVFYDYHTDIEETCLKKFQEHCSEVLSKVYSSKTTDSKIANPEEVVYFALLDKWALWLDEKGSEIEQCSKNNNDEERAKQKKSIVDSVKAFLDNHRLDVKEAEEKWLDFPQSQLTLALFSLCNKDLKRADRLFEKVIANDFFFAPEAYYYKACMRMAMKDLEDENYVDLVDAKKFFYYARTLLKERLESSEREATFVLQNLQQLNQKIRSNGFEVQQKANAENMQTIISNIDWLIGVPCHKEMFHSQKISKEMSFQIFGSLESDGIISPHVFTNFEPQGWMLKAVHDKFGLSNEQLKRSLVVAKASNIFFYRDTGEKHLDFGESPKVDDDNAFSIALLPILENTVKLSNRQSFYTELHESGVVKNVEQLKYANPGHETEVKLILDKKEIDPFALPTEGQHLVLNNGIQENRLYYKADDLKEIEEIEGKMMDEFIGEIDITMLRRFSYFSDFDGVQVDELAEYFEIPADGAAWLLRSLEEMGVFEQRMETRVQFTPNDELWKNKVLIFLEAKKNEEKNGNPIRAVASALENLRRIKDLQHLSIELLKYVTELKEDDDVERLYDHLMKEKLIEEYIHSCFRLNSRLDVSSLPASISDQVGLYLMSKFAYSFALERLCVDIDNGNAQKVMFHSIFLPEYPHKQFFDSLKSQEVISSQRIVSKEYQNIDEDLFEELDEIKGTLREHASKLLDQTGYHLTLLPLENYILGRSETLNSEIRFVSDKGLKLVVGVGESGLGWKILTNVVGAVVTAVRTAVSKIKAFGSWAYGIGSSIVHWVGDNIVDPVANKINKVAMKVGKACSYVKGKVSEFTQWVANSEAFKAASSCVKSTCGAIAAVGGAIVGAVGDAVTKVGKVIGRAAYQLGEMTGINDNIRKIAAAGRAIGNKVKEAAEWVAEKAVQLYEGAKREAVKAFEWVSETKLVKWAKSAGKAVIDFGKNVYQKMSNFISAVMESYEYYNQCRFYAKKIAVESQSSSVDEYTILRTYVNARQATACEEEGDETFRQKLQTHLVLSFEKAYARLDKVIYESVMKEICEYNLPLDLQSKLATIETFIKVSPSTQNFKSEVEEKFMIEASKVAIKFGYLMTEFATNDAPFESMEMPDLETEFTFGRLEGIVRKTVQDFANYQKLELKEKDGDDGSLTKRFIAKFAIELGKLIGEYCRAIYIDKPTKDLTAFMVELRKPGKVAEVADFEGEDLKLKRALAHCNAQIKEKRQNQGLLKELLRIVHQKVVDDVGVLKVALKFGYPLPICCLERIVPVLERVVEAPLRIQLAKREYGNGSALEVIRVDHIDDSLFISSRDYLRYKRIGVGNEEEETSVNSFLFDALQRRFPLKEQLKEREIFRNYLIQSL